MMYLYKMRLRFQLFGMLCAAVIFASEEINQEDHQSHFQTVGAVYQPLGNVVFVRNVLVLKIDCRQIVGLIKKLTDLLPKLDTIIE